MRIERKIFFASLGCGVAFWLSSSLIGYYLFYRGHTTFADLLFRGMPEHGTYTILAIFALFVIFGVIMSKLVARLETSHKELESQNDLLNKVIESLTHPFYVIDSNDYRIKIANSSACAFDEPSADICYVLTHNREKPCMGPNDLCPIEEVKKTKKPVTVEHIHFDSDGNARNIEVHGFPIFDDSGNVIQMIEYCIDITARRQAEKLLEDEKELLSVTLHSIGDGVIVADTEGKILIINKAAQEATGWTQEQSLGRNLDKVFHIYNEKTKARYENIAMKVLEAGNILQPEDNTILVSRDNTEYIITNTGAPIRDKNGNIIGVVMVFSDVTMERRMETELQRIDKLESIGVLAGGIAHDFNNIMTSIMGNISLALSTSDMEKLRRRLHSAENSCIRARDLTKQLLIFSKGGVPAKRTELIADFIKESVIFALSGSKIRADFHLNDDLMPVNIDEEMMNQVINNLVINSMQAMPEGGLIDVFAENLVIDELSDLPLKQGSYVKISIRDHGAGIPKEHIQRIFDPYFTTKQRGHGFGLSESYSIIKKHDGHITVESTLGIGTTLHIYLPISHEVPNLVKPSTDYKPKMGDGKILLMDDDKNVRDTIAEMLASIGYGVESAKDGLEAMGLYKQAMSEGQNFDAVILDLTVPGGMGGLDALQNLRQIDPNVKAILSSAYIGDNVMSNFVEFGFKGVIPKPYKLKELSEILSKVIKDE